MSAKILCFVLLTFLIGQSHGTINCSIGGEWQLFNVSDCRCIGGQACKDGLIMPKWEPVHGLTVWEKVGRALVYFLALLYLFLGVSIIADRFMAAIETITSQERDVIIKKRNGEKITITVRIWNETVSNLTLMALGSSAPEILLSIIEVCGNNFKSGELGPNTIVGSAAFNLFMIISICIFVIPHNEIRRQRFLRVFLVTATWSVFAYIWLYVIIAVISPGVVEIWEAFLTFIFFPVTVISAYVADRKLFGYEFLRKKYKKNRRGVLKALPTEEMQSLSTGKDGTDLVVATDGVKITAEDFEAYEKNRREFTEILKRLKHENPNSDLATLQRQAEFEMISSAKKSRAFYRVQTGQRMTGSGNVINKKKIRDKDLTAKWKKAKRVSLDIAQQEQQHICRVFFDPPYYTVMENVGSLDVTVTIEGNLPDSTVLVDYRTEDGTATADSDYVPVSGTLTFKPMEHHHQIRVEIIDDEEFEEDEHFYVVLENLRLRTDKDHALENFGTKFTLQLDEPAKATIMVLDDDHAGVFSFEFKEYTISENAGCVILKVLRTSGARGRVLVPYKTIEGTATAERDFEFKNSFIEFNNEETEKTISIGIVNDEEYEKTEIFFVELYEPVWLEKLSDQSKIMERFKKRQLRKDSLVKESMSRSDSLISQDLIYEPGFEDPDSSGQLGKPRLGQHQKCLVKIKESTEFKGLVDEMAKRANVSLVLGTSTWREQFIDAVTLRSGDDGDSEKGEESSSSLKCRDYVMHYLSLPWKILGAFCPPTEYFNGWFCFVVSIILIGVFTALIGDLANHFGCSIGLKDAVTAISFVAMGTSIPDTFASKLSATQDKHADSSIGNVTGSNAVNVFLGIGVAWTICAIVAAIRNDPMGFEVDPGTLAFSVTIFCTEAILALGLLLLRRTKCIGGELGGPIWGKLCSSLFLVALWATYLILSSLETYCIIEGF